MTGAEWADVIQAGTGSFLQVYSTVTQKPIATQRPSSVMDVITGTDLGTAGRVGALGGTTTLVLLAVVVGAVVIFARK